MYRLQFFCASISLLLIPFSINFFTSYLILCGGMYNCPQRCSQYNPGTWDFADQSKDLEMGRFSSVTLVSLGKWGLGRQHGTW